MKADYITKTLLAIIAVCLVALVVQIYLVHNRPVPEKQEESSGEKQRVIGIQKSEVKSNRMVALSPPVLQSNLVAAAQPLDPASEFNNIIKLLPIEPITVTNYGFNWGNGYIRVSDVKYDAQKTDSVIIPYVGFIIYKFKFGETVGQCVTNEDWSPFIKTIFQWQSGRWVYVKSMVTDNLETPSWDWVDSLVEGNDNINECHNEVYRIFGDFIARQHQSGISE